MYLQNKFFSNDEKYEDFIDDLYNKDILSNRDIDIIQNNKHINKERDDLSFKVISFFILIVSPPIRH